MSRTIFVNASILDGTSAPFAGTVVVEGNRIVAVGGTQGDARPGDEVLDLQGHTITPGLIQGHLHLTYRNLGVGGGLAPDMTHPPAHLAIIAAKNARELLEVGVTAGIGAGSLYNIDVTLKRLIEAGEIPGPRLLASGREFSTTGGPVDFKPYWWPLGEMGLGVICDGPAAFAKAAREETLRGVEIIKLFPEGGRGLPCIGPDMEFEEIAAAVRIAHGRGLKVRAHCVTKACAMLCVRAGVDIIDHADEMDDELIALFAASGTSVLPSLYCMYRMATSGDYPAIAAEMQGYLDRARVNLPKAVAAGVRIVTGDDFGLDGFPHHEAPRELAVYADVIGIDPVEVLRWATVNAADMVGWTDVGRIAPGALADLLIVRGDPSVDLGLLANPETLVAVMKDGCFVRSRLAAPSRFTEN